MKHTLVFSTLGLFCASVLLAAETDPKADVKAAAKKLGDKANYSWTSTPKTDGGPGGGFQPGPTEGQTVDGIVYVKTTFGDRTMESAAKGEKIVTKLEDAWEVPDETQQGPGQFIARRMKTFKAPAAEAADLADKAKSLKSADGATLTDSATIGQHRCLWAWLSRRTRANGSH